MLNNDEMLEIVEKEEYCIISTVGEGNIPYAFPMSYIYKDNYIYFHCAKEGHKIDNFRYNDNVCVTIVGKTELIPKDLDTSYESVVILGKVSKVEDEDKKVEILVDIVEKYAAEFLEKGVMEAKRDVSVTAIYKISIDKITGKNRRY